MPECYHDFGGSRNDPAISEQTFREAYGKFNEGPYAASLRKRKRTMCRAYLGLKVTFISVKPLSFSVIRNDVHAQIRAPLGPRRPACAGKCPRWTDGGVRRRSRLPVANKELHGSRGCLRPSLGRCRRQHRTIVAGIESVAQQGVRLAVLPETATTGYIFDDFAMIKPFLDTVPGKATAAIEKVTRCPSHLCGRRHRRVRCQGRPRLQHRRSDRSAYIGKYRKHGLNAQDQLWATAGNLGFPVFDTELGRISMLICYDDTYWQYARLAALHDVDIIVWVSASDRVMPGTPPEKAKGDHSTVADVQYLSAYSGAFVVAATRSGVKENPLTKQRLYYNGGSSVWDPNSAKIAQADGELAGPLTRLA